MWTCHSRTNNSKVNRLQESCLQIIYSDKQSLSEELLEKEGFAFIHTRNLQILVIEIYKARKGLSRPAITEIFEVNERIEIWHITPNFFVSVVNTLYHQIENINVLPDKLKNRNSLQMFELAIKSCKSGNCLSRLCSVYLLRASFIQENLNSCN